MNILNHISESLERIFWFKMPSIFDADANPDSGIFLTLDPGLKKFESNLNTDMN